MATIQTRKMNWIRTPTAWEQNVAWKEKRAAAREKFEAQATAFVNGLSTAWSNQITGAGTIAIQAATDRVNAAYTAKQAELKKSLNAVA
jgi:hypothetical protein